MATTESKTITHDYNTSLAWDANPSALSFQYKTYSRKYNIQVEGKPDLPGSADPMFRGDRDRHNPEDLFVAALSSCHLLSYLAVCARNKVTVLDYADEAIGTLVVKPDGSGHFESVTLRPVVTIDAESDESLALELHDKAHKECFIANSVKIPVHHEPTIRVAQFAGL